MRSHRNVVPFVVVAAIAALASTRALAGSVTGLTTFTAGTPAKSSEVNGNFSAVKTAVDDNSARIDALSPPVERAWLLALNAACAHVFGAATPTHVFLAATGIRGDTGRTGNEVCASINLGRSWSFGDANGAGQCIGMLPANDLAHSTLATFVDSGIDFASDQTRCASTMLSLSSDWADGVNGGWVACCD